MAEKVDYKKKYKELYLPKGTPSIIDIPKIRFVMIEGTGNPNGEEFAKVVEALYSFSYAVKMSYKGSNVPEGYYEYTVFPLEGEWDLVDKSIASTNKDNFKFTMMIRQPDFLTEELYSRFLAEVKKKKPNMYLDKMYFKEYEEGPSCQMLHIGSYDTEPASFKIMEDYCSEHGYIRLSKTHREIYLSDPRKTDVEKLKTVLRFRVENIKL